jgi:hypothetical protein
MSEFRHDLRSAFDEMSGPADPGFSARVHAQLMERAEERQRPHWTMAVAAAAIAVLLIGTFLYTLRATHPTSNPPHPAASTAASPHPTSVPSASPAPIASPSGPAVPVVPPSGFSCASVSRSGAQQPPVNNVTSVRAGTQNGYDRLVIQFSGQVPGYDVSVQSSPTFTQDPSGGTVTLQGTAGVKVVVHGATGALLNNAPKDLSPGYPALKEARQLGDFEGVYSWGLGVAAGTCVRVTTLTSPSRLVVDVATTGG